MKLAFDRNVYMKANLKKIMPSEVLFVTENSSWGEIGCETVSAAFHNIQTVFWSPGMPKPDLSEWHGDWIICFKADLILASETLARAKKGAINFHPSLPHYRGLGGYWWALNNKDNDFGVTVHHMDEKIDHGDIIQTKTFPILSKDTEESLKHRAAIQSLILLNETLDMMLSGKPLAANGAKWGSHLYTSKELEMAQRTHVRRALIALNAVVTSTEEIAPHSEAASMPRLVLG